MKNCLPQGGCVQQSYPAQTGYFADVSCGASNDWWAVRSGLNVSSYRWSEDFYVGDCLCYRMMGIGRPDWFTTFTDSAGRAIAKTQGYPKVRVICGPFESLTNENDFMSGGNLAPGFSSYDVDFGDPECMPWTYPIGACQPGCCPGNPPELPRTSYQ